MSIYTGYPSGSELSKLLYDWLSNDEKKLVKSTQALPDLAEQIFRVKSQDRNALISQLSKIFNKTPKSRAIHDRLAIIPHFNTIITTNNDTLFETSFKSKAQVTFKTSHIPSIDHRKIQIFKIHGDLNKPDSIILTTSDYNNFFKDRKDDSTYWKVISERISTNIVLFLGYNLEDPNVSVVFDRITDSLGAHRKEAFLVASNPDPAKDKKPIRFPSN
ncbi:MAG: hypothetical protein ACI9FU_000395 [Granulosicoccus sp.]|jgi:hypothetical protein